MNATTAIGPGTAINLSQHVVGLERTTCRAVLVEQPGGPPRRIDGYTVGAPMVAGDPPHDGEMHPDGDEVLYVISGHMHLVLELDEGDRTIDMRPGDALVVPRGVWHNIVSVEPGQIIHITPGPGAEARHRAPA